MTEKGQLAGNLASSESASMEEVLSSIRQIIAESNATSDRETEPPQASVGETYAAAGIGDAYLGRIEEGRGGDEILRLTNRIDDPKPASNVPEVAPYRSSHRSSRRADLGARPPEPIAEKRTEGLVLSYEPSASAGRSFAALNSALDTHQPVQAEGRTVDSLLVELLLPMLHEWMDTNLPNLVERLVSEEISRIAKESSR